MGNTIQRGSGREEEPRRMAWEREQFRQQMEWERERKLEQDREKLEREQKLEQDREKREREQKLEQTIRERELKIEEKIREREREFEEKIREREREFEEKIREREREFEELRRELLRIEEACRSRHQTASLKGVVDGIDSSVLGPSLQTAPVGSSTFEEELLSEEDKEGYFDWETCIEQLSEGKVIKAEKIAAYQFTEKIHPSQRQLNRLQEMRETSHSVVSEVCKKICLEIQNKSKHICNVWPAYKFGDENRVIFIVETNTADVVSFDIPYDYAVFSADYFNEDKTIATNESKNDKELPQTETAPLVKFIKTNAAELFKKHRHLSYIKPSLLRQEDSNKDKHIPVNVKQPCLAFYVRRKDYIPLGEEPFESFYEGFPAVVREGAFSLQTGIKMGCEITCHQDNIRQYSVKGMLGGFVEHPHYGLCGLTCAHVLLNAEEMRTLRNRREISAPEPPTGILVCSVTGREIGRIVKLVYEDDANGPSGMEIALFQIETGQPETAEFEGFNLENFSKGKAYGDTRLCYGMHVYKLGGNRTEGKITGFGMVTVRTHESFDAHLHSQMEVKSLQLGPFSEDGESGSLVFIKEDNEYICIGMVVGGIVAQVDEKTWEYSSVVIPIAPVLDKLGLTSFKSFVIDGLEKRLVSVEQNIRAVQTSIQRMDDAILQRLDRR